MRKIIISEIKKPINFLCLIAVFLFAFNKDICDFYWGDWINWFWETFPKVPKNTNPFNINWWDLRGQIITAAWVISFICGTLEKTKFSRVIFDIGIGFCVNDLFDRCNGINTRTENDIKIAIFTVILTVLDFIYRDRLINYFKEKFKK